MNFTVYNFFSKTVFGLFTQNICDINHQKRVKTLGIELKPKLVVRRVPASKSPHLHHTGEILKPCGGFTQKTHYVFFVHTTPEKFEMATMTVHFRLAFEEENWIVKSHDYHDTVVLEKLHFEMFSVHTSRFLGCHATLPPKKFLRGSIAWHPGKRLQRRPTPTRKDCVFKFRRFEEHFRKAAFSWRICVDGKSNRRNKAVFSNSSSLKSF